jgi:hypothetical protein
MRLALPQAEVRKKVGVLAGGHLDIGITVEEQEQGVLSFDGEGDAFDAGGDRAAHLARGFHAFSENRYSQR